MISAKVIHLLLYFFVLDYTSKRESYRVTSFEMLLNTKLLLRNSHGEDGE